MTKIRSQFKTAGEQQQDLNTMDDNPDKVKLSSNARKWRQIAQKQMLHGLKHSDYSKMVIPQVTLSTRPFNYQ